MGLRQGALSEQNEKSLRTKGPEAVIPVISLVALPHGNAEKHQAVLDGIKTRVQKPVPVILTQ